MQSYLLLSKALELMETALSHGMLGSCGAGKEYRNLAEEAESLIKSTQGDALGVIREREECARLAEEDSRHRGTSAYRNVGKRIAAAIRARGEP